MSPLVVLLLWPLVAGETMRRMGEVIELRRIRVPTHPLVGESHSLECDYSLGGENLYSIKWYKDQQEFYRYLPKEHPPALSFPVSGTRVDLSRSDSRSVHLVNVSLASTGLYQCEVSTEAPKFKTIAGDELMTVVHPPSTGPSLTLPGETRQKVGSKLGLKVGEDLTVVCSSPPSHPATRLKFYINNEIANDRTVHGLEVPPSEGILKGSRILLKLKLERRHFRYGELTVKCTSAIYEIYFRSQKSTFTGIDLGEHALGRMLESSALASLPSPLWCLLVFLL